ncbi:Tyrosine phosphatase family protein [Tranquillimonas rosea]|uniref:Tyrosine phosphatase family protein n=2 Tax=Tranquillimonas rosea TaxID=641238 RepID=A0A1H9WZ65_9RHOB|nr:Tyrosine phosphatase family protein [Tranquillimonas rosea]
MAPPMSTPLRQRWKDYRHRFTRQLAGDISQPEARRRAQRHFDIADHALLRRVWTNLFRLAPGVYRSNQPDPRRIARHAAQGLRSIITLRGETRYSYLLFEQEACAAHGITLHILKTHASKPDTPETYLELLSLFDTVERPFLIHCKSGADRTGVASALYLIDQEGVAPEVAKRQLALRYAHRKGSKAGVLGLFLDTYAAARARSGIGLRDWLATEYDPEAVRARFKAERGR